MTSRFQSPQTPPVPLKDAICTSCGGWTKGYQTVSPHQLVMFKHDRTVSEIGATRVLKTAPLLRTNTEVEALKLLQRAREAGKPLSIATPVLHDSWTETNGDKKIQYILSEKLPGKSLLRSWATLTGTQKHHIAQQVADFVLQLHQTWVSDIMQGPGEGPVAGHMFVPGGPQPLNGWDAHTLWTPMQMELVRKGVPQDTIEALRKLMPPVGRGTTFVFCHGDLSAGNVLQHDGEVTGVIDWEYSGFFPIWWDFTRNGCRMEGVDAEWKRVLDEYLVDRIPYASEARVWWVACWMVLRGPVKGYHISNGIGLPVGHYLKYI